MPQRFSDLVALVEIFQKSAFYVFTRNYWLSVMEIKNNYKKFKLIEKYRYEKKIIKQLLARYD